MLPSSIHWVFEMFSLSFFTHHDHFFNHRYHLLPMHFHPCSWSHHSAPYNVAFYIITGTFIYNPQSPQCDSVRLRMSYPHKIKKTKPNRVRLILQQHHGITQSGAATSTSTSTPSHTPHLATRQKLCCCCIRLLPRPAVTNPSNGLAIS